MTWVKLSDDFDVELGKFDLSDAARWTHVQGLLHVMRKETGGLVSAPWLRRIADTSDWLGAAAELVACGVWETAPGGWLIVHGMGDQPTLRDLEARREDNREKQARYRARMTGRAAQGGDGGAPAAPPPGRPVSNPVTTSVTTPVTDRVSNHFVRGGSGHAFKAGSVDEKSSSSRGRFVTDALLAALGVEEDDERLHLIEKHLIAHERRTGGPITAPSRWLLACARSGDLLVALNGLRSDERKAAKRAEAEAAREAEREALRCSSCHQLGWHVADCPTGCPGCGKNDGLHTRTCPTIKAASTAKDEPRGEGPAVPDVGAPSVSAAVDEPEADEPEPEAELVLCVGCGQAALSGLTMCSDCHEDSVAELAAGWFAGGRREPAAGSGGAVAS